MESCVRNLTYLVNYVYLSLHTALRYNIPRRDRRRPSYALLALPRYRTMAQTLWSLELNLMTSLQNICLALCIMDSICAGGSDSTSPIMMSSIVSKIRSRRVRITDQCFERGPLTTVVCVENLLFLIKVQLASTRE